jgi:hypothetical protein
MLKNKPLKSHKKIGTDGANGFLTAKDLSVGNPHPIPILRSISPSI